MNSATRSTLTRPHTPAFLRTRSRTGCCLLGLLILLATASCRTTEGLGKDVKKLGDNIEDAAK